VELTVILVTLALVVTTWALGRLVSRLQDPERDPERHS
jgi:Na+-transporting methylmalonyl-CoA/oxaloacetate decarboxylase gamma subunit